MLLWFIGEERFNRTLEFKNCPRLTATLAAHEMVSCLNCDWNSLLSRSHSKASWKLESDQGPVSPKSETFWAYFGCHNSCSILATILSVFLTLERFWKITFSKRVVAVWQLVFRARIQFREKSPRVVKLVTSQFRRKNGNFS